MNRNRVPPAPQNRHELGSMSHICARRNAPQMRRDLLASPWLAAALVLSLLAMTGAALLGLV